jgi:cell division protein FtsZ
MEAAQQAISSPLLDNISISGSTGVLLNITGGTDLTLGEVTQISEIVYDAAGEEAEIIFGAVTEPAMQGEIRVTVIATGFDKALGHRESGHVGASGTLGGHATTGSMAASGGAGSRNVFPINTAQRPGLRPAPGMPAAPRPAQPNDPNRRFAAPPKAPPKPSADVDPMDIPTFIRRQMD